MTETDPPSAGLLPWMIQNSSRYRPDWSQKPTVQPKSSTWVMGTPVLEPCCCISHESEVQMRLESRHSNGNLTTVTNTRSWNMFLNNKILISAYSQTKFKKEKKRLTWTKYITPAKCRKMQKHLVIARPTSWVLPIQGKSNWVLSQSPSKIPSTAYVLQHMSFCLHSPILNMYNGTSKSSQRSQLLKFTICIFHKLFYV